MPLLMILVVLAVIAVVAVVAAGFVRGGMAEPPSSMPALALPEGRPLAVADLEGVRFSLALRGYRMDEVDEVLARLGAELAQRDAELAQRDAELAQRDAELAQRDAELEALRFNPAGPASIEP